MSPDIQSFDLDKDPIVAATEEFTAKGQAKISAEISPKDQQRQSEFAKQLEKAKNGTLTFLDSILELAVPAAQAGEKTKTETNAWDNLNPDNPELQAWVDDYMKSSPAEQKKIMTELKRTRDINRAIEKVAESLPEIDPLPDNPDHQTMVKKLAEIEDRAKLLLPHGKKLTNKKDRAFFLAEMKKLFVSCKELRINLKNSRGNSIINSYIAKIFEQDIVIINKLRSYLDHASGKSEAGAGETIAAAEEAEAATEAKKIDEMTDEEFEEYKKTIKLD